MIAFCTNIWTHHQSEFCLEMHKLLGSEFKLVLFEPKDCEWSRKRTKMGWNLMPPAEDWIVPPPETKKELETSVHNRILVEADVAIIGGSIFIDRAYVRQRIRAGRLTLLQGERFFKVKPTLGDYFSIRFWRRYVGTWLTLHPKNVHYLTMSHWLKDDLNFYHGCKNRIWRWGYLTRVSREMPAKPDNDLVQIGWCGRMLDWKHVEYVLLAYARLPKHIQKRARVTLVGNGEKEMELKDLSRRLGLDPFVAFRDSMSAEAILEFMRGLDVYVFPSDRMEGWGAALVEAMNQGCAVLANVDAGSTLEVVTDGKNGYTFKDGDIGALSDRMATLIENKTLCRQMGALAWQSAQTLAPDIGAKRLVALIRALQGGDTSSMNFKGLCERIG